MSKADEKPYNVPTEPDIFIREGINELSLAERYRRLCESVQADFRARGITKQDLEEAIRWVRQQK